jgi:biopolymer transport protein TolQ
MKLDVLELVWGASWPVKMVLGLLILASLISWTMIFRKYFAYRQATNDAEKFEKRFWSGANLNQMYAELSKKDSRKEPTGMAAIFISGFSDYKRLSQQPSIRPNDMLEGVQRAMRVALSHEIDFLETHLSFLATVGSISPYIGLFGTVWGIMESFMALSGAQSVTIANVAPGIAEALIATAIGLFAAIPAVIAYNRYAHKTERLVTRYEIFMEEFSSIIQRQAFTAKA